MLKLIFCRGVRRLALALAAVVTASLSWGGEIDPFVGTYSGSAEVTRADGSTQARDLSVEISETRGGFRVKWTTKIFRASGKVSEKSYDINFRPAPTEGLYAAAQKKDLFGNEVQLDPMKGEPYVWGQLTDDALTVFALFVDPTGGYVMHQYERSLADGGLQLEFNSVTNGQPQHTVSSLLLRE